MSNQSPKTQISQLVTVAVQKLQGKVNFQAVNLKKGARVPELRLKNENGSGESKYPLIGDRYLLGRSSSSCDITIRNTVVSQIHCSLQRDPKNPHNFLLTDENSTNGVYMGKRRLKSVSLRHGDTFTLAPPDLANCVTISYYCPPPLWAKLLRYGFYGAGGIFGLLVLGIIWRQETHQELDNLGDFSPYLPKALVASEDSRFYWHFGVDPLGIVRAIMINWQGQGIRQGASTLTQQLARSLFPEVGRQNTAGRKLREAVVALQLEAVYSKDTILKTYLNRVYLGLAGYGFEDAARFYFDKSARDLDISEAATLVAMLPAPNLFNPIQDYDTSVQLRNRVIDRMAQLGMISPEEAASARRSRIEISPQAKKSLSSTIAPYFYSYVFQELQDLLGEEVAKEGNFIVETSLDRRLQAIAEKSLKNNVLNQGPRYRYSQGALVTLNSQTGEILALVGGVDYQKSQFNRAIQAKRQPGSTFKVFAYAAALEKGISPYKTYTCAGLSWQGQAYSPCERSSGGVNMFQGLARSENSVALRIAREAGLSNVVNVAERLGVKSALNPVPGLILGQSEVNVLEMTGAYAVFDHGGRWNRPHAIKRILDASDCKNVEDLSTCRVIYDYGDDSERNQQVIS
ncbi:MAG: FHA domain-containing protein, partial [Microcystis aeruginosa LG13-11]|nr:FHA domain-containing protein [Microcystis aeruginosa LG13-11]